MVGIIIFMRNILEFFFNKSGFVIVSFFLNREIYKGIFYVNINICSLNIIFIMYGKYCLKFVIKGIYFY